jgi:hypothetical protein
MPAVHAGDGVGALALSIKHAPFVPCMINPTEV